MKRAHINIGSNLGHRGANINSAVALLQQTVGKVSAASADFESEPWGFDSANRFLNRGVNVETDLDAPEILARLKAIEQVLRPGDSHRDPRGGYADRFIDLDLIALDGLVVSAPGLSVPHPAMHMREFVLIPMAEIWPDWVHPLLNLSPAQLLENLGNNTPLNSVIFSYNKIQSDS